MKIIVTTCARARAAPTLAIVIRISCCAPHRVINLMIEKSGQVGEHGMHFFFDR